MDKDAARREALLLLENFKENQSRLSEREVDEIMDKLEQLSPDPEILDYIFHRGGTEFTPSEIIERAFSYKPICL